MKRAVCLWLGVMLAWLVGLFSDVGRPNEAMALTACVPSDCTPACGSTCTYYVCPATDNQSSPFSVNTIPTVAAPSHAEACREVDAGKTYTTLEFAHQGITYTKIPETVAHTYATCESRTRTGPPCPPPGP